MAGNRGAGSQRGVAGAARAVIAKIFEKRPAPRFEKVPRASERAANLAGCTRRSAAAAAAETRRRRRRNSMELRLRRFDANFGTPVLFTVGAGWASVWDTQGALRSWLGPAGMRIGAALQLRASKLGLAAVLVYSCLSRRVCASFDCTLAA